MAAQNPEAPQIGVGRHAAADRLIARCTDSRALSSARETLASFPDHLLRAAAAVPVHVWLLDAGEGLKSVPLLDRAHPRRWLDGLIGPEDCAGLTLPLDGGGVLVVAPGDRPTVLRHEIGHALAALLTGAQRHRLSRAFAAARREGSFVVPLAARSVGEYLATGVAHYARFGGAARLGGLDAELAALLGELWRPPAPSRTSRLQVVRAWLGGLVARPSLAATG